MRKYFLIPLVVFIIFLVSFFYFSRKEDKIVETKIKESFCNKITFEPLNKVCHITFSKNIDSCQDVEKGYDILCNEIVIENLDLSENVCMEIKNDYGRFLCYSKLAVKLKNPEFCKDNFDCYWELAISTKDSSFCEYLPSKEEKYKCLTKVNEDVNYCNDIEDGIEKKSCEGLLPEEVDDCEIENYYNHECLLELARNKKEKSICNLIAAEDQKWVCIVDVENDLGFCKDAGPFFEDLCRIEYLKNYFMGLDEEK